jgi:hypothetical protein
MFNPIPNVTHATPFAGVHCHPVLADAEQKSDVNAFRVSQILVRPRLKSRHSRTLSRRTQPKGGDSYSKSELGRLRAPFH